MTEQQKIIKFIESFPTKGQIEKEAGLPQGKLSDKRFKWRPETLQKVKEVVKKYGYGKNFKSNGN